jgi:hemoglobin/transferrin/lactoferrin receptor protein
MKIIKSLFIFFITVQLASAQSQDSSYQKMDELVISADRFQEKMRDLPRQIELIDQKKILQLNQQTTANLLEQTGSVFVQKSQQGGGSPVIRGFEANRVLLVMDGIRLNNAIYRSGHLQNVIRADQYSLESMEVLFGPGSLMYGSDALGGVVHFNTLKPKINSGISGNLSGRYSSANQEFTGNFGLQASYKKFAFLVNYTESNFGDLRQGSNRNSAMGDLGLRKVYSKRLGDTDRVITNSDPNLQVGSGYKQQNLMTKILFQPKEYQQHLLSFHYTNSSDVPRYDRLSETVNDTPTQAEWYYGPEKFTLISYQFEDGKERIYSDQIRLSTSYQNIEESRNSRGFGSSKLTQRNENVKVASLNLDLRKKKNIHEIRYGLEYAFNQVNSKATATNVNTLAQTAASTRYPDGGSQMWWLAAYASLNQELNSKWVLSEGIRISHTQLNSTFKDKQFYSFLPNETHQSNTSICGNIGVVYLPNKNAKIYANTGNAYRTPNVDDMNKIFDSKPGQIMVVPNENLKPEQSWTSEIGVWFKPIPKISLEANVYYTKLWNALVVLPSQLNGNDSSVYDGKNTAIFSNQNAQGAYIYGYHFQLNYLINSQFSFQSSVNYTYGRIQTDSIMPADHIPPVFGRSSLDFKHKKWQASLYSVYSAAKKLEDYYLNGEDNIQYATANGMPAWYTLNIQGGVVLGKKESYVLRVGMENILDRNYRTFSSGMSAAGRNIWVNFRIKF